jgi:phage baseplate assembly protein W
MADVSHYWSADLLLGPTGDLGVVDSVLESQQRILRRLLTNPGDYIWQPDYGAGLPALIGQPLDLPALTALIKSQMYLESSVVHQPEPLIIVNQVPNGIYAQIQYVEADSLQPTTLSFTASP